MVTIEIRPGEGGLDAQQLVKRQADIYRAFLARHQVPCAIHGEGG